MGVCRLIAKLVLASIVLGCIASPALADKKHHRKKRPEPEPALAVSPEQVEPPEAAPGSDAPPTSTGEPAAEPAATAAPPDETTDREARALFKAGEAAFAEGRFEQAIDYFERSYELSHRPVLLLNIASAADRIRQDRVSLGALEQYLRELPEADNRAQIEKRIAVLKEQIARHEAEEQRRALAPQRPAAPVAPPARESPWPWVLSSVGVAAAGTGAALVWLGSSAGKHVEAAEEGSSFDDVRDDYERSARFPPIGFALLGAGGLCLTSGVIWLIARDGEEPARVSAQITSRGVQLRGRF
jgi:tetratricopeptide (TPR) repeat protein